MLTAMLAAAAAHGAAPQEFTPELKLRIAENFIDRFYVDSVDMDKAVEDAIVAMLNTLDPHSVYSNAAETKELNEPLEGNFSGVGIQFYIQHDTLMVVQTIAGGPSEQVGIRPGDRIVEIDDTVVAGVKLSNSDVRKKLRGPKGSTVTVKVLRRGEATPLFFRIERADIPLYSVDAAYMADPKTGYIRVSRFGADTPKEFSEAVKKLKKQGMENLLVDLEDNGGGYLGAAVEMANQFLHDKDLIVYTQGRRMPSQYFRAEGNGDFTKGRVVVMVNEFSASASEILSGALQDNDRAPVVGRRTFGKGLVQRPYQFPDGSMIRLTVSRYYTPSGRSIQKPYTKGDDDSYNNDLKARYDHGEFLSADSIHFADSLRYQTLHRGRTVYGGGGIMPDVFVPIDTTGMTNYYRELRAKNVFNNYALDYLDRYRDAVKAEYPTEDAYVKGFEFTPAMVDELVAMADKLGVKPNPEQLEESRDALCKVMKGLIGRDIYESGTYFRVTNELNPVYREALKLINDKQRYQELLK